MPGFTALCLTLMIFCFASMPEPLMAENTSDGVFMEADGIFQLAKLKMKQQKYNEAEVLVRQLAALAFPQSEKADRILAGTHLVLVDSLMRQNKWKDALKDGHLALKLHAYQEASIYKAEMLKILGKAFEKTGDDLKAARYFEDSLKMFHKVRTK